VRQELRSPRDERETNVKRLIRAFLIGTALGFLAGLVAPPREQKLSKVPRKQWGIQAGVPAERAEKVAAQPSEK
jgi:hypothetical protein